MAVPDFVQEYENLDCVDHSRRQRSYSRAIFSCFTRVEMWITTHGKECNILRDVQLLRLVKGQALGRTGLRKVQTDTEAYPNLWAPALDVELVNLRETGIQTFKTTHLNISWMDRGKCETTNFLGTLTFLLLSR